LRWNSFPAIELSELVGSEDAAAMNSARLHLFAPATCGCEGFLSSILDTIQREFGG
jgi:hypothetical protein